MILNSAHAIMGVGASKLVGMVIKMGVAIKIFCALFVHRLSSTLLHKILDMPLMSLYKLIASVSHTIAELST